jgi:hypothetical protein
MNPVAKIISGGQTGVDRGALEAAIQLGIPHGGWCPHGRLAEDGVIDPRFQLQETDSPEYHVRTSQNVLDSDGTLILHRGPIAGGTDLTRRLALEIGRPLLLVDLAEPVDYDSIRTWLQTHSTHTLNIAGPRESTCPGITEQTRNVLLGLFQQATTRVATGQGQC